MFAHIIFSVAQFGFVAWNKPFYAGARNVQEVANESAVVLASYHLLCFSDWIHDKDLRRNTGFSLLGIIGITVFFNMGVISVVGFKSFKQSLKRRKALKKWKKK